MKQPTYKEQHDKIVSAYMKGELKPINNCACFIGNLLNGNNEWAWLRVFEDGLPILFSGHNSIVHARGVECIKKESKDLYSIEDIIALEHNFLKTLSPEGVNIIRYIDEDRLFKAMATTLEMLKQIHISKGEKVEEIEFVKRELG